MDIKSFQKGIKDGIPIALGYFAVSFSLGIYAKSSGLTAIQGFFTSILMNASAGEYVGFTLIASAATIWETILGTLVTNARYFLMSCSLSQKFDKDTPLIHRFLVAYGITDELFGIAMAQSKLSPFYSYGAYCIALPSWAIGTALGIIAGNILPIQIVSALSVALYGMFLSIIIVPAKKDKVIAMCIVISFVSSWICQQILPFSEGTIIILLTIIISAGAAYFFPRKEGA